MDIAHLREAPLAVRIIKLVDRADNLRESLCAEPAWASLYLSETRPLRGALAGTHAELEAELDLEIEALAEHLRSLRQAVTPALD